MMQTLRGIKKDREAVLEEAAGNFSLQTFHIPDVMASCNMLPNVDILTSVCKSLDIVALHSPPSCCVPLVLRDLPS